MAKSTSKLFESEEPKEMREDALNLPEENIIDSSATILGETSKPVDDVVDLDISAIKKKRFRINGDSSRILELNTSDLNIATRMSASYERLVKYMDKVGKVLEKLPDEGEEANEEHEAEITKQLDDIDKEMRKELDYIFDAPVSEVCGYGGSMYDPFNGMFRYEHIMDAITKLYETNLNSEFNAMRKRINAKTSKYTKKYHN